MVEVDWSNPAVVAAAVAAGVSLLALICRGAFDLLLASLRTGSERSWADYELRRDAYLELMRSVDALTATGTPQERGEFHRAARSVRLVGSDEVVRALNALTGGIRHPTQNTNHELNVRAMQLAMRADIRGFPPKARSGTKLTLEDFPLER